jgi:hypothetical protein
MIFVVIAPAGILRFTGIIRNQQPPGQGKRVFANIEQRKF